MSWSSVCSVSLDGSLGSSVDVGAFIEDWLVLVLVKHAMSCIEDYSLLERLTVRKISYFESFGHFAVVRWCLQILLSY